MVAINFIPNDPLAPQPPMRQQNPRPDRPANRAGFTFLNAVPERLYDPDAQPREFLFWQCREAALIAAETWERLDAPLGRWSSGASDPRMLEVDNDHNDPQLQDGQKLNAYYDRVGLRFFIYDDGRKAYYSGRSTDTVTHEAGHALLDTIRPEFWDSFRPEVNAFHEAFGDCWALLSALMDQPTRQAVLEAAPNIDQPNFLEALSEYLSQAIRDVFGNVAPSKPREALNTYKWELPTNLPPGTFQDPPELLSAEPHSLSRVFTGCFYDMLVNLLAAAPTRDDASLLTAAQTAGRLLIAGARTARHTSRFFQEMGQSMVLADQQLSGGANSSAIQSAFVKHNLGVSTGLVVSPTTGLAGPAPKVTKAGAALAATTVKDLRERLSVGKGAKLTVVGREVAGGRIAEVVHQREVPLGGVDKRLAGVVALAQESVRIGDSAGRAAVLGAMPESDRTVDETLTFVTTLMKMGRIEMATPARKSGVVVTSPRIGAPTLYTHTVKERAGKKILTRLRYVCVPATMLRG